MFGFIVDWPMFIMFTPVILLLNKVRQKFFTSFASASEDMMTKQLIYHDFKLIFQVFIH